VQHLSLEDDEVYWKRGNEYREKGQYDKAILDYNKAIEINPKYVDAYKERGIAYGRKGQYDLAFKEMRIGNRLSSSQKRKKIVR